jgi:hypothetical protein
MTNAAPESVGDILDRIEKLARQQDRVAVGDVVEAMGNRGFGPFLIVIPLIDISPVGSIPGLPTAMAAIVVLIAIQLALARRHLWLPGFVRRRAIASHKVRKAVSKMRGVARFMDRWFHGRLPALTSPPVVRVAAVVVIALACAVPPLELLPLATTAPMLAIAAFGLAITVRDGALMIVAVLSGAGTVAVGAGLANR